MTIWRMGFMFKPRIKFVFKKTSVEFIEMLLSISLTLLFVSRKSIDIQAETFFATLKNERTLFPEFDNCHTNVVVNQNLRLKPGPLAMAPLTIHRFSVGTQASMYWDISKVSAIKRTKSCNEWNNWTNFSSMFHHLYSLELMLHNGEALLAGLICFNSPRTFTHLKNTFVIKRRTINISVHEINPKKASWVSCQE